MQTEIPETSHMIRSIETLPSTNPKNRKKRNSKREKIVTGIGKFQKILPIRAPRLRMTHITCKLHYIVVVFSTTLGKNRFFQLEKRKNFLQLFRFPVCVAWPLSHIGNTNSTLVGKFMNEMKKIGPLHDSLHLHQFYPVLFHFREKLIFRLFVHKIFL